MGEQRRTYDAEFKREALKLLETGGKKAAELAEDLGINVHLLYRWKREEAKAPDRCFSGMGRRMRGTETEEEILRLRRELDDVRMERDILKKRWPSSPQSRSSPSACPGERGDLPR